MSRFRRYAHSLASGYVLLGANMLFTLASVPLALHYLSKTDYGLWALVTSFGGYLALVDFGLSASIARILIDHKDDPRGGQYGAIIQTGILVGAAQGIMVLALGSLLAQFAGGWLEIAPEMSPTLQWLLIGQCAVMALSSAFRTFSNVLSAHQRFDVVNYGQAIVLAFSLAVMWVGFACGLGAYSFLVAHAGATLIAVLINFVGCRRLGLLPKRGEWGRPSWKSFKGVFAFGNDIFIYSLGCQLINFSQGILLARLIGLEAVTVWSVCTRVFVLLQQTIYRLFDYSSSAFAEMIVRNERVQLAWRFRQIVLLSSSLSVAAAAVFALSNKAFVDIWTGGRFESPLLQAADIKAPTQLIRRFADRQNVATQHVWERLSESTRAYLQSEPMAGSALDAAQQMLATDLNRIIKSDLSLSENLTSGGQSNAAVSDSGNPSSLAWVNRHALEDLFPQELADSRKARWVTANDLLLALWLVLTVSVHAHTGLVGQAKAFGFMRYIFFLEGIAFIGASVLLHRWGIPAMLGASVAATLAFSFFYGLWRTRNYFQLSLRELASWHQPAAKLALWILPAAVGLGWLTLGWSPLLKLTVGGGAMGVWASWGVIRYGLDETLQAEIVRRSPARFRTIARRMLGLTRSEGAPSPRA
ncbi:MAG TPA: oligosaccharide flippase family protein [Verrucomicrobiae bacterium]|nr:oligosaccharide flippase family protein [Verrucomicrobiae bacterium]